MIKTTIEFGNGGTLVGANYVQDGSKGWIIFTALDRDCAVGEPIPKTNKRPSVEISFTNKAAVDVLIRQLNAVKERLAE